MKGPTSFVTSNPTDASSCAKAEVIRSIAILQTDLPLRFLDTAKSKGTLPERSAMTWASHDLRKNRSQTTKQQMISRLKMGRFSTCPYFLVGAVGKGPRRRSETSLFRETNSLTMCRHGRRAILVKSLRQLSRNLLRASAFDLVALHHVDKLAILEKAD